MLQKELDAAIAIAKKAGAVVLEHYSREIVTEEKIGFDNHSEPVTEADRAASTLIVDELTAMFPEDAVLSEEERDQREDRLESERVWIVDPIDGTWGFIKKDGDFAVQIGLTENGRAIVGAVYLPAQDKMYYAAKGLGAFVVDQDGEPKRLTVSERTDPAEMNIAVSRDHRSPKMTRIVKELGLRAEVGRGSVGVKIGLIAEQDCDLYIHLSPRTKFWDTCAPQMILEESGGVLTDLFGNTLKYDRGNVMNLNGIFASNGAVHASALERLKPILDDIGRLKLTSAGSS